MKKLHYFGTDDRQHGHFIWDLDKPYFQGGDLNFKDFPFSQRDGWSIYYVEGSAIDTRPGTKSVWFVNEIIPAKELKERILNNELSQRLIKKMPFIIKW